MKRISGFTLIELIVALTIVAIIVGAGIPSLSILLANSKADNGYRQLFTLLQFARSQSVFYRQQVVICPSTNQKNCNKNWQNELIVFVDSNRNKKYDAEDILLQTYEKAEDNIKRIVTAFGSTKHLSFNYDGSSGSQNGRLTYCVTSGKETYARQIIISKTGRAREGEEANALLKCG